MASVKLTAEAREAGHNNQLRRDGFTPAVVYGRDLGSQPVKVETHELERLLKEGAERGVVELDLGDETQPVMIKEVQRDPVRHTVRHADFYAVSMDQTIQTTVPLVVTGIERATRDGGVLQQQLHEVSVECLPGNIPDELTIDVGDLGVGDVITVADLAAVEDVTILNDANELIASIVISRMSIPEPGEETVEDDETMEVEEIGAEDEEAEELPADDEE